MTIKKTVSAAAIACALISTSASALPMAYINNPTDYATAYASIAQHLAAGQKEQVVAELPRIGLNNINGSDIIKFKNGLYDIDRLLASTYYTFAELAPPAAVQPVSQPVAQPVVETVTATTQPVTAAIAAPVAPAESAGVTIVDVAPTRGTVQQAQVITQPAAVQLEVEPAQQPPADNGAAANAKAASMAAGKQAGLTAAAIAARQKANAAAKAADPKNFQPTRINYDAGTAKMMIQVNGDTGYVKHDEAGYYMLKMEPSTINAQNEALKLATETELEAQGAELAAAQPQAAAPVTKETPAAEPTATPPAAEPTPTAAEPTPTAAPTVTPPAAEPTATPPAAEPQAQPVSTPAATGTTEPTAQDIAKTPEIEIQSAKPAAAPKQATPAQPKATAAAQPVQVVIPDYAPAIEENRQAANNAQRQAQANGQQIAKHEQRLDKLDNGFKDLRDQVNRNKKEANAGIAGAIAIGTLPQVMSDQTFGVTAAGGTYNGESAVAVGFSARASQSTVLKAGVTTDTAGNFGAGAGVLVGW